MPELTPLTDTFAGVPIRLMTRDSGYLLPVVGVSVATPSLDADVVSVSSTVDCFIAVGVDPRADEGGYLLPPGETSFFHVPKGERLAVTRQGSKNGVLELRELRA